MKKEILCHNRPVYSYINEQDKASLQQIIAETGHTEASYIRLLIREDIKKKGGKQ